MVWVVFFADFLISFINLKKIPGSSSSWIEIYFFPKFILNPLSLLHLYTEGYFYFTSTLQHWFTAGEIPLKQKNARFLRFKGLNIFFKPFHCSFFFFLKWFLTSTKLKPLCFRNKTSFIQFLMYLFLKDY